MIPQHLYGQAHLGSVRGAARKGGPYRDRSTGWDVRRCSGKVMPCARPEPSIPLRSLFRRQARRSCGAAKVGVLGPPGLGLGFESVCGVGILDGEGWLSPVVEFAGP
jgi:hypothetical protein